VRQGRPCARGEPGSDGEPCPYIANEPLTDAGWQAWDVLLRCSGQLRMTQGLAIGLDLGAMLKLATALGYSHLPVELFCSAEAGTIRALNEERRTLDCP
jgi:hypothetical protein